MVLVSCKIGCPINLSYYEHILGVRQWCHDVALRHGVFCVSTQHRLVAAYQGTLSRCICEGLMCLFIVCETMFTVGGYHKQFPMQMTQNNKHNKSVEKIFHQNCSSSRKCRLKFIASGEDHHNKKLRSCEHRNHKHVQKRGNTYCRCFKKWWGDQATLAAYSKIIFFKTTICSNYMLHELDNARQEYLFNRLRTAIQPLHREQQYIILLLLAS